MKNNDLPKQVLHGNVARGAKWGGVGGGGGWGGGGYMYMTKKHFHAMAIVLRAFPNWLRNPK